MAASMEVVRLSFLSCIHRCKLVTISGYGFSRNIRSSHAAVLKKSLKSRRVLDSLLENRRVSEPSVSEFVALEKEFPEFAAVADESQYKLNAPHSQELPTDVKESIDGKQGLDVPRNPVASDNLHHILAEKVTPLYQIPYEDQLKIKYSKCKRILKDVGSALKKMTKIHVGSDLLPCALEYIVPSPVTEKYRNKDEFSIRYGIDGNPKTVGFFIDSIAENPDTLCISADEVIIIKDSHKALAKDFENYIRQSSLDVCINFSDGGHWRNIIARSNTQDEVMAIATMHPQQLTVEQKEEEKEKLKRYFLSLNTTYNLKSLYFQECFHTRCTSAESPFQLLFGDAYLFELLNGMKFRISPESFFQTNTLAAEHLMKVIFNLCQANESSVVLDICCGTGPISLTFAPYVKRCIGIDISPQAIADARVNAKINNIENVEFSVGTAESLVANVLDKVYGEEFIAIVNPSRSCLGKSAIHALRSCKYLTKVLYVSCKPSAAIQNFTELSRSAGKDRCLGKPFHPMIAVPVDLFPHTDHCELAILFQRL